MPREDMITFSTGIRARLVMPDLYAVLAQVGSVPSPAMAAVLRLLEGTAAVEPTGELARLQGLREFYMGLYNLAALCMVDPRLRLDGKPPEDGEIGPRDLSFNDIQGVYYRFFLGQHPQLDSSRSQNLNGTEGPAPAGEHLSSAAEPDRGGD